jgi:hypothetical protein
MPLHRLARLAPRGGSPLPCDLKGRSASCHRALTCIFALIPALLCPAELFPQAGSFTPFEYPHRGPLKSERPH